MRIFRMILECVTPLHCGSGEDDILQDQPVIRDAFGLWRIPGSSLAGALRSLSEQTNPGMTARLFGECENRGQTPAPSLIWCEDAVLLDFDGKSAPAKKLAGQEVKIPLGPYVRDHVCLDLERGSAVDGGKFDAEIVPAGTRFLAEIRCDGWNRALSEEESAAFDDLCALMLAGALDLGGKTANGYGRYRVVESGYQRLDMTRPQDMEAWLNLSRESLPGQPLAAKCLARPGHGLTGALAMPLVCNTPILVGGGAPMLPDGSVSEADIIFALSPWLDYGKKSADWRPVLPGSALKGVLRHAMYRILRDNGLDEAVACKRLNGLFGHIEGDEGQCGKLVVEDCPLNTKKSRQLVQHVAIDRFTGGAQDGALFGEEPVWADGLELSLHIHVREAAAAEAALIFQALLDLGQGLLAVGSGGNRGNGRLRSADNASPQAIIASLAGNLAWNGRALLAGDGAKRLQTLLELAEEWERATEEA